VDAKGIPTLETPAPLLLSSGQQGPPLTGTCEVPGGDSPTPPQLLHPNHEAFRYDFDETRLPIDFQWLRTPWPEELFSLTARPGFLRLYGRESIGSLFRQSLVARRQQSHCFSARTIVEFEPEHFQQMAGLVCYYSGAKFHYLYISHDETVGKHLRVMSCLPDSPQADAFTPPIPISARKPVQLRVEADYERLYFGYRIEELGPQWNWLPQQFDASILSDEASAPGLPNFTGAFVGMACQDMAGTLAPADFDFFEYQERSFLENPLSP
jgi:xylan 1,4-beta-xylosidase